MSVQDLKKLERMKKSSSEHIEQIKQEINDNKIIDSHLEMVHKEYHRVTELSGQAGLILNQIDKDFKEKTALGDFDIILLFIATGLQILRQYLVTKFPERLDDKAAAKENPNHIDGKSDRHHRYYNPSLEEIKSNPVPFDANVGSAGALSGGGTLGHRAMTLGHDPVLGLVFGTANIATSTLTTVNWESYHIKTGLVAGKRVQDIFGDHASTLLVLKNTIDKAINQGLEGKEKIAWSLYREIDHLISDVNSKNSLPLPFSSLMNPAFASELASYGFDMANVLTVGKQASYAFFINSIIAMIHRMIFDEARDGDEKLYEVRTRKILSYSNVIATSSNIVVTAVSRDLKKMDFGGLLVTIYRVIDDYKFINEIKRDFLKNELEKKIVGSEYDFMSEG